MANIPVGNGRCVGFFGGGLGYFIGVMVDRVGVQAAFWGVQAALQAGKSGFLPNAQCDFIAVQLPIAFPNIRQSEAVVGDTPLPSVQIEYAGSRTVAHIFYFLPDGSQVMVWMAVVFPSI